MERIKSSSLLNYNARGNGITDYIREIKGSHKIGKYLPGTIIPVVEEERLFQDQPNYALFLSWHIADELIPKLREKGFLGKFIIPLPEPIIIDN